MTEPLSKRLRDLAAEADEVMVNHYLDMAREAEIMEWNLAHLLSITASTVFEFLHRKNTAKAVLLRHRAIIDTCLEGLKGRYLRAPFGVPVSFDQAKDKMQRAKEALASAIATKEKRK